MSRRRRVALFGSFAAAISLSAAKTVAETPLPEPVKAPAGAESSADETIQITGTRTESRGADLAVPVQVLDKQALASRSPEVLTDALREEPNVHVQATTVGQGSPYIRGVTGSSILNLVDGMRLNHAIYRSSPNPYLALVDAHLTERIEIVRGPASVLYGSDAMGGVIQVISKKPVFEGGAWETRGSLDARFGTADLSRAVHVDLEGGRQGLGMGAGFSFLATEDLRGGGSTGKQAPTAYRALGGNIALLWEPAPNHRTTADFQLLRQPETPRYDELVPGFGQTEPASDVWNYEPLERLFGHVQHSIEDPFPGVVDQLRFDAAYQRMTDDRRTRDHESIIENRERNASRLLGFTLQGVSSLRSVARLTWGAEAYFDEISSSRTLTEIDTGLETETTSRFPDGSQMNSYGAYLNASIPLGETAEITAGLRYSHFDTKISATELTPNAAVHVDDVTGALGFLWRLRDDLRLVANASRGFRAPNVFDMGTLGPRPGNRFNLPSGGLDPEVVYTGDLGLKWIQRRARGEIFGFFSYYDDKIESVFSGEVTPDGRDVVRSANVNKVRLAGVEARGKIDLRHDLQLSAFVFWTWGEEEDADGHVQPADRIPPLQGLVALRWWPVETVWLEAFTRFAGPQDRLSDRDERDPRIDPNGTAGWATGNLRLGWQWTDHLSGSVAVENVTNASYREHGSGLQAPGVSAIVSLNARF